MICFYTLQPITFVDDTNLFSCHSNIKDLFKDVNLELNKITAKQNGKTK